MRSSLDQLSIYAIDMITVVPLSVWVCMYLFELVRACGRAGLCACVCPPLCARSEAQGVDRVSELPRKGEKVGKGEERRGETESTTSPWPCPRSTHRSTFSTHSGIMVSIRIAEGMCMQLLRVRCKCGCGDRQGDSRSRAQDRRAADRQAGSTAAVLRQQQLSRQWPDK